MDIAQEPAFHKPPTDVLITIFQHAIPSFERAAEIEAPNPRQAPLNISHVCRFWRDVSLSSPKLWCRIVINENVKHELVQMMFHRSSACPLDMNIDMAGPRKKNVAVDNQRFIHETLFNDARHRWRSVYFTSRLDFVPLQFRSFEGSGVDEEHLGGLSRLEELTLRILDLPYQQDDNTKVRPLALNLSASSKLQMLGSHRRHVRFCHIGGGMIFTHLHEICLRIGTDAPLDMYFGLLATAPALETLSITFLHSTALYPATNFAQPIALPSVRVALLKLRSLFLDVGDCVLLSMSSVQFITFLHAIEAPFLQRLNVHSATSHRWIGAQSQLDASLSKLMRACAAFLVDVKLATNLREDSIVGYVKMLPNIERFSAHVYYCSTMLLSALCPHDLPRLQHVSLRCGNFSVSGDALSDFLVSIYFLDGRGAAGVKIPTYRTLTFSIQSWEYSNLNVAEFCRRPEIVDLQQYGLSLCMSTMI